MKLAITVDQEKQDNVPERGLYKTNVSCNNNATGEWDYNAWNLKLDNVSEGTKCNVTFTSGLTQEEYNNYLDAGIVLRRNTYRGKDITDYKNLPDENEMNLYKQISSCQFNDIYIGDYIKTNENNHNITWVVADINNYMGYGRPQMAKCHVTIIPHTAIAHNRMNDTNSTAGGYINSEMFKTNLPKILEEYITPVFQDHVLEFTNLFTSRVDESKENKTGLGVATANELATSKIDLMSEINIFGIQMISSSYYEIGYDNQQYAIFRLRGPHVFFGKAGLPNTWLKTIANNTYGYIDENIVKHSVVASRTDGGVWPRFLIG